MILIAFLATATAWNVTIPPYENLDELEHAEVIRHLVVTGRLPVHDKAEAAGFHVRQEASQPPLYHVLGAVWARLLRLPTTSHAPREVPAAAVACGFTGTLYNKATWRQDPYGVISGAGGADTAGADTAGADTAGADTAGADTAAADTGARFTVHALRSLSTLLQLVTLAGTWTLARRIFPRGPVPALATIIVAFNPQFLLLAAGVNNDNAITPLATWGLVLGYDLWERGPEGWRPWAFGVLAGLAALSKLSGLALVGVGGLALLVRLLERRATLAETVRQALPIGLIAAAVVAPWMVRNLRLYGDPTALAPMLDKVGHRETGIAWGEARLMWLSYWGQLPCTFYPDAVYWPYLVLSLGGILPLAFHWRRMAQRTRRLLALCGIWFIVIVVAWMRWSLMTHATGGRLLFPAIAALALLLAAGWHTLGNAAFQIRGKSDRNSTVLVWSALLPLWSLLTLVVGPRTIFGPPALLPEQSPVPNPLSVTFDGVIALQGYRASVRPGRSLACVLESRAYCAPTLDLDLYWQADAPVSRDLTMVIQLLSPVPGATDLRLNYNHWPGRGNLATSAWPPGVLIRDHYRLPLPPQDRATQAWTLQLAFVDPASGMRLPVVIGGEPAGDAAALAQLRVPDAQPAELDEANPAPPVTFANPSGDPAIILETTRVEAGAAGPWEVTLGWRSERPAGADLTVFVHAYDAGGVLLGTGDGPPAGGAFPTHLWQPGDRIVSTHSLALDPGAKPARISVGLYAAPEGTRWPATRSGTALPDGAAVIWDLSAQQTP